MNDTKRQANAMPYISSLGPVWKFFRCKFWIRKLNKSWNFNLPKEWLIFKIIGIQFGKNCVVDLPFRCAVGNIEIGDNFYCNTGCTFEDPGKITIGNDVFVGPDVLICTSGHPVHPEARNTRYEYGIPITIGNNVWIGGRSVILPGVHIGDNTVIGGGSVVTKDIPANVVAVGNPCRILREISEDEKEYFFKDRKFDEEAWEKVKDYQVKEWQDHLKQ